MKDRWNIEPLGKRFAVKSTAKALAVNLIWQEILKEVPTMKTILTVLAFGLSLLTPMLAAADASGPDYFRVVGVASNDVLNIRERPTARSSKVGAIPPNGNGIQNLGCQGGLSFAQWEAATAAEREVARKRVWCRIYYRGVNGWVAGWFLAEGSGP